MIIGIDASRYGHEKSTGVEWYSFNIVNEILELEDGGEDEIRLYSREKLEIVGKSQKIKNVVLEANRFWTLKKLSKEMRKNPPDVLFVPSHTLPLSLPKRTVITIHDVAFRFIKEAYSFAQYHHLNWSTKFAVKRSSKIIVPSQATKNDLIQIYKCPAEKITVIHHGFSRPAEVDDVIFQESEIFKHFEINPQMKYLLFVGRLESKKNLVGVVEAFAEFQKEHADFKLILAGKRGVGFAEILKKINELELMHKVIMPGYITEEEKAALYKHCQVFVFPSLYEGFGFPLLEAFYYKKPILTSKIAATREVCGESAWYVDPYKVEEIAVGMKALVEDENLVKSFTESGFERLKMFDWRAAARDTLKVIKH